MCSFFHSTERLLSQWGEYDRSYEELSHWLKDMEVKVKASTDLQPSLVEKKALLNKYKVCVLKENVDVISELNVCTQQV